MPDAINPWTPGLRLLSFIPERQARSFIGKLVNQYGRARVLKAVEKAAKSQPANPQEYLVGLLKNPDGPKKWSDEWVQQEVNAGRIQAKPGESYSDVRKRMRSA